MAMLPAVLLLSGGGYWGTGGRYVETDNAYIHQPMISISPDVSGRITGVSVGENQTIEKGAPLFEIDPAPYRIALDRAEAALAAARDLEKTTVRATSFGTVSQIESLNVGQCLSAGSTATTLVAPSQSWVEANFKETQLDGLAVGQPVEIGVDAYPSVTLHGRVESFGSATGSQFSLIPAQNATGNWAKVVQRVPVRIRIDGTPEKPLRDGMSVYVAVDTGHSRLDAFR